MGCRAMSKKKKKNNKYRIPAPQVSKPVGRTGNPRRELDPKISAWNDMQIANIEANAAKPSSSRARVEAVQEGKIRLTPALAEKRWHDALGLRAHPVALSTDFDEECEAYISSLIEPYPVVLKRCEYGMGLYAAQNIQKGSTVLEEDPSFSLTQNIVDRLESVIEDSAGHLAGSSLLVAGMVQYAVDSPEYPCKISDMLPLRCLGSIPKEKSAIVDLAFLLIGEAYQLPSSLWTKEECQLLHDKAATNMFEVNLYIATSMFNHSCRGNVGWFRSGPDRRLVAARPIQEGEELFYPYIQEPDPFKRRAKLLGSALSYHTINVCQCREVLHRFKTTS